MLKAHGIHHCIVFQRIAWHITIHAVGQSIPSIFFGPLVALIERVFPIVLLVVILVLELIFRTNVIKSFGSYNIVVFLTICISYANNCFTL